jgi:hypothetical protein
MVVRGRLERADGGNREALSSANLIAEYLEEVDFPSVSVSSRDFR